MAYIFAWRIDDPLAWTGSPIRHAMITVVGFSFVATIGPTSDGNPLTRSGDDARR